METVLIKDLSHFHELSMSFKNSHPIFRGVSSSEFKLISKFGRNVLMVESHRNKNKGFTYDLKPNEEFMLNEFIRKGRSYSSVSSNNKWDWLALAQHHGLATRLLDWTINPLVAVYFACHGSTSSDSAIYVIENQYDLKRADLSRSPFKTDELTIFFPDYENQRIALQGSLFTLGKSPELPLSYGKLHKWIIPKEITMDLLGMAKKFGINTSSIYPGLDGIALSILDDFCGQRSIGI